MSNPFFIVYVKEAKDADNIEISKTHFEEIIEAAYVRGKQSGGESQRKDQIKDVEGKRKILLERAAYDE